MAENDLLRQDTERLDNLLSEVITTFAGASTTRLFHEIRTLARRRRAGEGDAPTLLADRIRKLTEDECELLSRAFSIYFDLVNLAEDLQRIRVLREREAKLWPAPNGESLGAAVVQFHSEGWSAERVQEAIDKLGVDLVFTAHPTEAKRRSIRAKLRRMRAALMELNRTDLLPREREKHEQRIQLDLSALWQTDFVRPWRPTVLQEVERGLSIKPRLWEVVPQVYESLRRALSATYPGVDFDVPVFLQFGSWMGGDRDGNPNVTADITQQTVQWLRDAAIQNHLAQCRVMYDVLSLSSPDAAESDPLEAALADAARMWPAVLPALSAVAPRERCRRWMTLVEWRLKQSAQADPFQAPPVGGYVNGAEFVADLEKLHAYLVGLLHQESVAKELVKWIDLAKVFGLHFARLDVRQDSRRFREAMTEYFAQLRIADDFGSLPQEEQEAILVKTMDWRPAIREQGLSPIALDTLRLFRLLRSGLTHLGPEVFGGCIISLTHYPSDILTVLWLWNWSAAEVPPSESEHAVPPKLRIIPLFEQIEDLRNAGVILDKLLSTPAYRSHLAAQGDRQSVMIGYSDSTKDGGYLAACWGLYRGQDELQKTADRYNVKVTFFHGRGGSLGRGGGPAARGILSLPPAALDGTLRLTEQGEVLAERYDDVQIAFRHLEQVTWATLIGSTHALTGAPAEWHAVWDRLARRSYTAYRHLVDLPGFIRFFGEATPIDEIETLNIGSRPARRRGERTLNDLRAIPWVFSWTQNRSLIPAWYGLGTALVELQETEPASWQLLQKMYREWPFVRATLDNAALALAKADLYIIQQYAQLTEDPALGEKFGGLICEELERSRQVVAKLLGRTELLSDTPWLQASIDSRNPYIDPINLMQIELMRRKRAAAAGQSTDSVERLQALLRLTVQGVASGLRTTG